MEKNKTQSAKDNLAFIIGGIFILGLVFATYTYFNKTPGETSEEKGSAIERIKEMISSNNTEREEEAEGNVASAAEENTQQTAVEWVATDYQKGDLQSGSYTVRSGDTLWEIAEAVYGDGTQWTRILDANMNSVGFLPDGSQALIFVGQVLTLP